MLNVVTALGALAAIIPCVISMRLLRGTVRVWGKWPITVGLRTGRYTKREQCVYTFLAFVLEPIVFYWLYTIVRPIRITAYPEIFNLIVTVVALLLVGMLLQLFYNASVYYSELRNKDCVIIYVITVLNIITAVICLLEVSAQYREPVCELDVFITGLIVMLFWVKSVAFKQEAIIEYTFKTFDPIITTLKFSKGESLNIDLLREQLYIMRENGILIKNSAGYKVYRPEDVASINTGDTVAVYDGSNWVQA